MIAETERPYLSVIVPVYNVEAYVERCVRSLLEQDFPDFELLLVDDGSRDRSGALCDALAECDGRIRVFHKENGGVSFARNVGLDAARGEWVAFVDSDDWVKPGYLSALVDDARQSPDADLVFHTGCPALGNSYIKLESLRSGRHVYHASQFSRLMEDLRLYWAGQPVAKLWRRELINAHGLRFPLSMHAAEDIYFFFSFMDVAERIVFRCIDLYVYVNRAGSLTHRESPFSVTWTYYERFRAPSPFVRFVDRYALSEAVRKEYLWFIATIIYRALTNAKKPAELRRVTDKDWDYFRCYFKATSRKSALDARMMLRFRRVPAVLLPYLAAGRVLRTVRIFYRRLSGSW